MCYVDRVTCEQWIEGRYTLTVLSSLVTNFIPYILFIHHHQGNAPSKESGVTVSDPTVDNNLMDYSINLPNTDFQKVSFEVGNNKYKKARLV